MNSRESQLNTGQLKIINGISHWEQGHINDIGVVSLKNLVELVTISYPSGLPSDSDIKISQTVDNNLTTLSVSNISWDRAVLDESDKIVRKIYEISEPYTRTKRFSRGSIHIRDERFNDDSGNCIPHIDAQTDTFGIIVAYPGPTQFLKEGRKFAGVRRYTDMFEYRGDLIESRIAELKDDEWVASADRATGFVYSEAIHCKPESTFNAEAAKDEPERPIYRAVVKLAYQKS